MLIILSYLFLLAIVQLPIFAPISKTKHNIYNIYYALYYFILFYIILYYF